MPTEAKNQTKYHLRVYKCNRFLMETGDSQALVGTNKRWLWQKIRNHHHHHHHHHQLARVGWSVPTRAITRKTRLFNPENEINEILNVKVECELWKTQQCIINEVVKWYFLPGNVWLDLLLQNFHRNRKDDGKQVENHCITKYTNNFNNSYIYIMPMAMNVCWSWSSTTIDVTSVRYLQFYNIHFWVKS